MTCAAGHDLVPLLWTSGGAGGMVTRDAFERITCSLVGRLSEAMPVDAVYLDLHGAMVTEDFEDGEGELLRRVRAAVGPGVPMAISLDYHANVTPQMVEASDALIAYRTYPHVDRVETGQYAAKAMQALLERGRPAGRALRKAPFLIPLNGQCTLVDPSKSVVARSRVAEDGLVNLSYLAGFPPSDLHWCGPSVIAHAWTQAAADRAADDMLGRDRRRRKPISPRRWLLPRRAWRGPSPYRARLRGRWSSRIPRTIRAAAARPIQPACSKRWSRRMRKARCSASCAMPRQRKRRMPQAKAHEYRSRLAGVPDRRA